MAFKLFGRKTDDAAPPSGKKAVFGFFLELIEVVAISLLVIIPVRYFLIQPFYVKGPSMEPNFFNQEYLIIDELSYRFHTPQRGDVVVFRYPLDPSQFFIKRVIGLPGETVEVEDGHIKIYNQKNPNGVQLDESAYLDPSVVTDHNQTVTLKDNQYFMMGDNRPVSEDSRAFGPVDRSFIVGRVWLRAWPFDRWRIFTTPTYPNL